MSIKLNDIAKAITEREGGKEEVNIAQVNDVLVALRDLIEESIAEPDVIGMEPDDILETITGIPCVRAIDEYGELLELDVTEFRNRKVTT